MKMRAESDFLHALTELDLGPLQVEINAVKPKREIDAYVTLRWGDESELFAAEFKQARALRDIRNAVWQAREYAKKTQLQPLLVVPYLNAPSEICAALPPGDHLHAELQPHSVCMSSCIDAGKCASRSRAASSCIRTGRASSTLSTYG